MQIGGVRDGYVLAVHNPTELICTAATAQDQA